MCALLVAPKYLILVRLLKISNSKQELQNKQRLVEGEVTMCVGSGPKIDMVIIAHSYTFEISVKPKQMLFGVCVEHEYDLIMFIAIRLFI